MALAPTQGDLAVPRLRGNLGNYHVMRESKLGAGSYGVVYLIGRVESAGSLRQRVALKFIVGVDGCPGAEHRAQHEADLLRMVEHPGVVKLIETLAQTDRQTDMAKDTPKAWPAHGKSMADRQTDRQTDTDRHGKTHGKSMASA